ncbi:PAAR domain-containing protein [Erwinia sp. AnSW2-5]|uniref:PAAR domain-containing protein n=1 Tax=Erwinia sp. AnSW2-5 TaxID=3367692 RepID=UPI00385C8EA9
MAKGYYLVQGDKTTCGGRIIEGATDHTLFSKAVARERDKVTCGQHPGIFMIAGGIRNDTIHGRMMAGTLDSTSSCPCRARFVPSMMQDTYEKGGLAESISEREALSADLPATPVLSSYITGQQQSSNYRSGYPAIINTYDLPDEQLRGMFRHHNQDIMLLTLSEVFEVLASWGMWKSGWVSLTESAPGNIVVNYGVNIKDVVTTSMLITQLGSFGIKVTAYINHKGTELIKVSGYPGVRKIINAPVFMAKNPKMIDLGLGKYGSAGVTKNIIAGARLTFIVAAAYRTIDFILNDETSLAKFIGSLATDVVKLGLASVIAGGAGIAAGAMFSLVIAPTVAIVIVGFGTAMILNWIDNKFGVTDKVIAQIEAAQQEVMMKARKIEKGVWDLGSMFADNLLEKGKEVIENEIMKYLRDSLENITPRIL